MPDFGFAELLKYGPFGFSVGMTGLFLWFWNKRDILYNKTITDIDTKNREQQKDSIKLYTGVSDKYEKVVIENAEILRDVKNAMYNVQAEIARG